MNKLIIVAVPEETSDQKLATIAQAIVQIAGTCSPMTIISSKEQECHTPEKNKFMETIDNIIKICGDPENSKFSYNLLAALFKGTPGFERAIFEFIKRESLKPENKAYLEYKHAKNIIGIIRDIF